MAKSEFQLNRKIDLNTWPHPHTHAIGQITIEWNQTEKELSELISVYLETDRPTAQLVIGAFGNRDKCQLLKSLVELKEGNSELAEAILHAITCFDICRENRNHIIHSSAHEADEPHKITFRKPRKAKPTESHEMVLDLNQVRECANEIWHLRNYMIALKKVVSFQLTEAALVEHSFGDDGYVEVVSPPLPEKPQKPRKLDSHLQVVQGTG